MPELPEVETTRRGLAPHVVGQHITQLKVRESRLRWPVPADLPALVAGQPVLSLTRRAKYLLFQLPHGYLLSHLGMSGSWRVLTEPAPLRTHDHLVITMSNACELRYHDPRRFGCLLWTTEPDEHALLRVLGPEPLAEQFDGDYLFQRSRGKSAPIKTFLMDNHVVVGVGNIYAQEALFLAGIRPGIAAGRVTRARYQALAEIIRKVLSEAIQQGGTTLRDFVNSDGEPGYFAQQLRVYGREGLPCHICQTPIKSLKHANRTTSYCPQCQQ